MEEIHAAGVFLYAGNPIEKFLLLRHADRWDFPKGHCEPGEPSLECALREMQEETGVLPQMVDVAADFVYTLRYPVSPKRLKGRTAEKVVDYYLARLLQPVQIQLTEHIDFEWRDWKPPHHIQQQTVDGLLAAVAAYFDAHAARGTN